MTDSYAPQGPQFDAQTAGKSWDHDELRARFDAWDDNLSSHWSSWREQARLWFDFVGGKQWTDEETAEMEGNGKIPVTFNLIDPVISAVQGAEIQNRQQVQYYPRDVGDTGVSDVLTQGAEYVTDECNGDQEDSEAFWDCLVCGMGWTEQRPEVEGEEIDLVKERVDPLQMLPDPAARKRCLEDMRYLKREIPMSRDEFADFKEEIDQPDLAEPGGPTLGAGKRLTVVNPRQRYTHGMLGGSDDEDTVIVCEWQWWDWEPVTLAASPDAKNPQVMRIRPHSPEEIAALTAQLGAPPKTTKSRKKAFYRAFQADGDVLFVEPLPEGDFRYKAITGKRERTSGTWYGLVKPMLDPGRFVNKLYSEVLHIVRTNANGGLALEEDAVSDIRRFESTWAATDKVTWFKPGALSGPHGRKILPKDPPQIQVALFQLMEFARDMVKATTGVNEEILGLVAREQAGVLEAQRKQAAYGILSAFFDGKRRYQRNNGRLLLSQMRVYFPNDKLVRIVDAGTAQYVPLSKALEVEEYDIVVDEAPAGPDQKQKVLAVLMPLLPQFLEAGLIGPEALAQMLPYLPIPAAVANQLAQAIQKQQQNQAAGAPLQQQANQAELENMQADTQEKVASAEGKRAKAFKDITDAHASHIGLGVDLLRPPAPRPTQGAPGFAAPGGPPPSPGSGGPPGQPANQGAMP